MELFLRLQQQRFLFTKLFLNCSSSRVVHVCVILYTWRPAGRKTRIGIFTRDICVSGEIIANFLDRGFQTGTVLKQSERSAQMWRRPRNVHVLLHVRAYGDSPVSLAMTHMRWLHGQSGHESTGFTQSGSLGVGGLRAWPMDRCSNRDAGKSESKTPTPCECEQARRQINIRPDDAVEVHVC